jgi:2,3-bisphosphoglycerate-dependent phosphoglycerate mutase
MAEFVVVRHGSTQNLEAREWQGWSPVPLSSLGREQALLLAQRLAAEDEVREIFFSPLVRTRQTADFIAQATAARLQELDALKERMTPTRLWGTAHDDSPDYASGSLEHRFEPSWAYEDEEPWPVLAARILEVLALMRGLIPEAGRFVFVTHGITLRLLAAAVLAGPDQSLEAWLRVNAALGSPDCCSIAAFIGDANGLRLDRWNDSSHLAPLRP